MISLDSRSHARLLWVGALLAPAIAVQAVRLVSNAELTSAQAAAPQPAQHAAPVAPPAPTLSPKQTKALAWVNDGVPKLAVRSPMQLPPRVEPKVDPDKPAHDPDKPATAPLAPQVVDDRPTNLKLTGMIGSNGKALAAISGKLRQVGDQVAPGWTIERIDSHNRVVVLKHTDGRRFEISPPTPSLER